MSPANFTLTDRETIATQAEMLTFTGRTRRTRASPTPIETMDFIKVRVVRAGQPNVSFTVEGRERLFFGTNRQYTATLKNNDVFWAVYDMAQDYQIQPGQSGSSDSSHANEDGS